MRRRALVIGVILLALVAVAAVLIVRSIDFDRYRSEIARQLSRALGREVRIDGPLSIEVGFVPRIEVEDVTLANAPGRSPPEMAKIGRLGLEIDLRRLLEGELALHDLHLRDAEILLEWDKEGRPNWPSGGGAPREETSESGLSFALHGIEAEDVTLRLHHVASGSRRTARIEGLWLDRVEGAHAIEGAAVGELESIPFDLSGTTGIVSDLVSGKSTFPIDLSGEVLDVALELSGTIGGEEQRGDFDLRVSARAPGGAPIAERFGLELPDLGPVQGSGKLSGKAGAVRLSEISLQVGRADETGAKLTGEIADLLRLRGVDLAVAFRTESLHHLSPLVGQNPPEIGAVTGTARLTDHDGTLGIEKFGLHGGHEEVLRIEVTGRFGHLRELAEIGVRAELQAKDLSVIGDLFDEGLPPIGPVEISGRVEGDREHAEIREMRARLDKTHFTGEVQGSFAPGSRPHLTARLESPTLHLDDVGLARRDDGEGLLSRPAPERLGSDFLPFDQLHRIDADVSIRANRVVGRNDLLAEHADFVFDLEGGNLEIGPMELEFQGGRFSGSAHIDARPDPPELSLDVFGAEMDLAKALAQVQERPAVTGMADVSLQLESRGRSAEALRAALQGNASMAIHDGELRLRRMNLIAQDVFRNLYGGARKSLAGTTRKIVVPFKRGAGDKKEAAADTEPIQCFAADFGIVGGVATARVLALDTGNLVMVGTGTVDLVEERWDIHVEPNTKRRSLLTVTIPLDIEGSLNRPKVSASLLGATGTTATSFFDNMARSGAEFLLPFVDDSLWSEKSCADLREALYH